MDFRRATLLLIVCYVSGIDCYIGTVDFFSLCGSRYGYDKLITDNDKITVTMYGSNWPRGKTSCTVIFKASAFPRNLKLTFGSYKVTDTYTLVNIIKMVAGQYMPPTSFDHIFAPDNHQKFSSSRYLKVTIRRLYTTDTGLSIKFDINTDEFGEDHTDPLPSYTDDYDYTYLSVGSKIGIAFGTITAIAIVAVIIYYGRYRYSSNGGVFIRPRNVVATTCSSGIVYSHMPPPTDVAAQPAYSAAYPSAYPTQTGFYPST